MGMEGDIVTASMDKLSSAWAVVFATDTKRLLLGKRGKSMNNPNQWGLIGGSMDGEENPVDALVREAFEEAKLKLRKGKVSLLWKSKHPNVDKKHSYFFLVRVPKEKKLKLKLNNETSKFAWMTVKAIRKLRNKHFTAKSLVDNADKIKKGV